MSRILILLMFVFWLAWKPQYCHSALLGPGGSIGLFLAVYALLVLGTRAWSQSLARQTTAPNLGRGLARFNLVMFAARVFILIWFVAGLGVLGWWQWIDALLQLPRIDLNETLVGMILGTLPPMLAWIAMWWSQYPAEIAFREQNLLSQLDADLPVHSSPSFKSYFASHLRLQFLFVVVPVLLIVLTHDLIRLAATVAVGSRWGLSDPDDPFSLMAAALLIFVLAPEILRRVLHTEPLPNGPLRRRLEALCRRTGVRYRDILLWRTQNNLGNAAVMGFVPRFRYVLLSDLLLETMSDEQVEAVFAHELGHIVHRHMAWLAVFIVVLWLFIAGGGAWAIQGMSSIGVNSVAAQGLAIGAACLFKFLLLFGFVSRRLERQADVFAARTMELSRTASCEPGNHVGEYGANLLGSALHRVAVVNNIPIKARSWCHGSIATRMRYLRELSADPVRTQRFDRFMQFLYGAMVFALFAGAAFCYASNILP